jgi:hypothetical protein
MEHADRSLPDPPPISCLTLRPFSGAAETYSGSQPPILEFNLPLRCADGTTMETNRSSGRPWSTRLCLPLVASSVLWATACASAGNAASSETPSSETPTSPSGTSVETRTYEGDGYSFAYPASWTPSQPATGLVEVLISAPPAARQDGILPNINVVLEPLRLELSTDQYYLASKQTVAGMFAGFELVDQGRTRIDGQLAWWMDYRWHSQGTAVRQRQAYQVRGDTGYVITFTASPSAFEEHLGSQLIVEESFRIA